MGFLKEKESRAMHLFTVKLKNNNKHVFLVQFDFKAHHVSNSHKFIQITSLIRLCPGLNVI